MNERIAAAGLVMGFGLGFMQLACGTEGTGATGSTPPPLTAEERAVTEKTAKGTLAEITLPDEKVRFVEYEPGRVLVMHQARIGGPLTRVPSEDKMTLPQIFHAYAPDQEVPSALTQAMARVAAANLEDAQQVAAASPDAEKATTPGIQPVRPAVETHDDLAVVSSALASSIDGGWFTNTYCNVYGADWTWCYGNAGQGGYASWTAHRTSAVACGDTGAARMKFFVSGSLKSMVDVPYGQCWLISGYHGPHGFLGVNLERALKFTIDWAEGNVRFAGWMAREDQFLSGF